MSHEYSRRHSSVSQGRFDAIPNAPPLPAPRPLQRARNAATRFFGYQSRPASPQSSPENDHYPLSGKARHLILNTGKDATATHRTGLEINTLSINEKRTHALLGGKDIFKTVRVEDGKCVEDFNLKSSIRSNPLHASGKSRQVYSIDIADVAWAKGDYGDYVAAATSSGKIILYDLGHAGLPAAQLYEHYRQVHRLTFNPHSGSLLLSGSQDGSVRLWDVRDVRHATTIQSRRKYSGQSDGVRDVKWSPTDGVDFAFGTDSGSVQSWDMRNLKTAKVRVPAHNETCASVDWHPDGKHIASASPDKSVKVWDISSARKHVKPSYHLRTPYAVTNARWRPACDSLTMNGLQRKLCAQLVTSYDRDHPVLHVWDLRRRLLPLKEIVAHSSAPTDMLWHSRDLLWTVGTEGNFLQTQVQYAPKVIDRRNLQTFAVSTQSEVTFAMQRRPKPILPAEQRRMPHFPSQSSSRSDSSEHIQVPPQWADDGIDQLFLSTLTSRRRTKRSASISRTSSNVPGTPVELSFATMLALETALSQEESSQPVQVTVNGPLPLMSQAANFEFLAKHYRIEVKAMLMDDGFL